MLCEAAWVVVRTPGPLRAFYQRVRSRRGAQIALVATARKLCVVFWHLLTREEDYAFGRPSLTRRKLRALELKVGKGWRRGRHSGPRVNESRKDREREREFAEQSELAYRRLVKDWQPKPKKKGAVRHRGAHLQVIFLAKRQQRGRPQPQNLRFSSPSPAPGVTFAERRLIA